MTNEAAPVRMAVVGAGSFGRNHVRVLSNMPGVQLAAILDVDEERARALAAEFGVATAGAFDDMPPDVAAAVVATPTLTHESVAERLLGAGIDVLVEKPIAHTAEAGERLTRLAEENGQILQVGHLERFNPAVVKLSEACTTPLFFEVHRLSLFTPRSLDVDVVRDLMIHDLDIVLSLMRRQPEEIRAAGISILSRQVDIAHVRLAFSGGCVVNLTASRVSTEQVRKLRLFQPGEYLSVDYQRQDLLRLRVVPENREIGAEHIEVAKVEPLAAELSAFVEAVRRRSRPKVDGHEASAALRLAEAITDNIEEHATVVSRALERRGKH